MTYLFKKNSMQKHFDLSDSEFKLQFVDCTLNPELFSHEAHIRLAWINIKQYGMVQAEKEMQNQLQNFVNHIGVKGKYNKTLTIASMKIVNHFILKSKSETVKEFLLEFPKLNTSFKELISAHYSFDIFDSEKAKNEYIMPDLLAFSRKG